STLPSRTCCTWSVGCSPTSTRRPRTSWPHCCAASAVATRPDRSAHPRSGHHPACRGTGGPLTLTGVETVAETGVEVVRARVPGKINLTLGVGGADASGYHRLVTVFQAVSLHDEVVAACAPDGVTELVTVGREAHLVDDDETN